MFSYSVTQWLFIFYIYCFCGWCFESAYVSLKSKSFVNRGFMRGPFLPLYGSGGTMMLVASKPFMGMGFPQRLFLVYAAGVVGATVLEYVTGVAMEALFKVRYWDYSDRPFNFQGHICLKSSLAWGFLTILMTEVVHKPVEGLVLSVPGGVLAAVTSFLTALIGADFALSFKAAMDLRDVLAKLENAREELAHMQKRLDVIIAVTGEEVEKHKEELEEDLEARYAQLKDELERRIQSGLDFKEEMEEKFAGLKTLSREKVSVYLNSFQRGMLLSHPTMSSKHFGGALKELREELERRRRK